MRRMYVVYLLDSLSNNSVPELMRITGYPRRTLQKVINGLDDYCVECVYDKDAGKYIINNWASIDKKWVYKNIIFIKNNILENE